jgi:hypothetical protein
MRFFLTLAQQFLMNSILRKGIHETQALENFLLSCKQTYAEFNPAADLDHAEADRAIQELREGLRL